MKLTNETFAPLEVMVDEFVRAGIRHAVICPGSRNAPIAYALAARSELKGWSVLDERQAGFFALGIAKSTGSPVIVTCTSGTAAANLHPAVIEADHAGVPLIVMTADRPPELRDVGAGQAIDQLKLYGDSVRWFLEAGNHLVTDQTLRHFRSSACRAVSEACAANPGPVHLNFPLREPLRPVASDLSGLTDSLGAVGRAGGAPWSAVAKQDDFSAGLATTFEQASRPIIVVGEQHAPGLAAAVAELSAKTGAPVFADALSQLRRLELATGAHLVTSYDLILRAETVVQELRPDLIVRIGETPTSKPLRGWLAEADCRQILLDPRGRMQDPAASATDVLRADALTTVTAALSDFAGEPASTSWSATWSALERAAQAAIDHTLPGEPFGFEPALVRAALSALDAATIFVSSSMPIRDVETYGPVGADTLRYLANRGTNGIDGVVSTALGVRAPFDCDRVVLITGDLAFLYDAGALAIAQRHGLPLTVLLIDNSGGGIFSFLPLAEHEEHFEDFVATPHDVDIAALAQAYGIDYSAPVDIDAMLAAIEEPGIVHVKALGRAENKLAHDRVAGHVLESVAAALAEHGSFH